MKYAELHCKTNFSFLEGASFSDELIQRAAELELHALAVTDRNSLAGVVRAHRDVKKYGGTLVIGAEIVPSDGSPIVFLPRNRDAYGQLSRLITIGRRRAEKGKCDLTVAEAAAHAQGSIGILIPPREIDALKGWEPPPLLREAFGDRLFAAIEAHFGRHDVEHRAILTEFSRRSGIPLVAANDVHYHEKYRQLLQDVLVCIREGCTIQNAGHRLFPNAERRLKSGTEMFEVLGPGSQPWIERSVEIAEQSKFSLDDLLYEYPEELTPAGTTSKEYLKKLTWAGARERWPNGTPEHVRQQIERELNLIVELKYEAFFLTIHDLVSFANKCKILCQGRGSAANSAVCYCLGITSVDPAHSNLLFERFISKERDEEPDIDVDFEHERREEVMQYVYEKYGRDRAGIVAETISYRPKSAARDVGKALGFSLDLVDRLAEAMDHYGGAEDFEKHLHESGADVRDPLMQRFRGLCSELMGFPRHLSQHVGGFVITQRPLCELVPIENAAMDDRTVIEWNKDDIETLKILKVDCLALGMLTCLHRCFNLVRDHDNRDLTIATIPPDDKEVYEMCSRADTIGVFQIESRAQMSMLPRLRPKNYYDLVIEVSIVRPGPIQGGMVHPYLRRRAGKEEIKYPNDALKEVLKKTLGVPLFQEQVMRLAVVAAGFTPGEADQLRRSMASWRRGGEIDKHRERFIQGMLKNNYERDFAEAVFKQIEGFGEYGFPESHAASFAILVYASAWLKFHYHAAFTAALLNSQPMGFYAPAQLIRDAQRHDIKVLPADVNHSDWDCKIEDKNTIRLGFREIKGLSQQKHVAPLLRARAAPFRSIAELAQRTELTNSTLAVLARADVFQSLGIERRKALWQVMALRDEPPLFKGLEAEEQPASLPQMPLHEHVSEDYRRTRLSLKAHPLSFAREELDARGMVTCLKLADLDNDTFVRVAGIVLVRQHPMTANGVIFLTLEDETHQANIIVWPKIFERFRREVRGAAGLIVEGRLQKQDEIIHVVASRIMDLSEIVQLHKQSRDFH